MAMKTTTVAVREPEPADDRDEAAADAAPAPVDPCAPVPFPLISGDELPSGRKAIVRGMKGAAHKALYDSMQAQNATLRADLMDEAMQRCIVELENAAGEMKAPSREDVRNLSVIDRRAVLLRMLRRSYPTMDTLDVEWLCSEKIDGGCESRNLSHIHLESMESKPPKPYAPAKLPHSGKTLEFDPATGNAERAYLAFRKGASQLDLNDLAKARGVKLDGKRAKDADLDDLMAQDREAILSALQPDEGPDSRAQMACNGCGKVWKTRIEALPGFFFRADRG